MIEVWMIRLKFEQLLNLYRHIAFDPKGDEGELLLANQSVLDDLLFIENNQQAAEDSNFTALIDAPEALLIGQRVRIRAGAPRTALGQLVRKLDDLFVSTEARLREPPAYFIKEGALEPTTEPPPDDLVRYRKALEIANLFGRAASYLDSIRQDLVFIKDRKITIPILYDVATLRRLSIAAADSFLDDFSGDVHQDQKLTILAEAILHIAQPQPTKTAFSHMLANIEHIQEEVRNGYKLFASSFSYAKIKNEIESAKIEYIAKIHKTIVDIQGQLLGVPLATVIVGSQLKIVSICGIEFWANFAVTSGAWVFLILLLIAIGNQWATLSAIRADIDRQQRKLQGDYATISDQFSTIYASLSSRIFYHKACLFVISFIGVVGVVFATFLFFRLTTIDIGYCIFTGGTQLSASSPAASASPSLPGPIPTLNVTEQPPPLEPNR